MTTDPSPPQPMTIQKFATAVYPSFAMLAVMKFDVFTPLTADIFYMDTPYE